MTLHWTVDSKERLVIAIAEGTVTRAEVENYITVMSGAGTLPYRKLFDCSRGDTAMTAEDMLAIGVQIRATCHHGHAGTARRRRAAGQVRAGFARAGHPRRGRPTDAGLRR